MNKRASLLLVVLIIAVFAVSSYFIVFKNLNVFSGNSVIIGDYDSPVPVCGDGVKNGHEECDGNSEDCYKDGEQGICLSNCTCDYREKGCGDGILQLELDEECDDGNLVNDDGCSIECKKEAKFCGDGILQLDGADEIPETGDDEECDSPVCISPEIQCEKDKDCIVGKMLGDCVKEKSVCEGTNILCYSNEQCQIELKNKSSKCVPEKKGKCKFSLIDCTAENVESVCPSGWTCSNINGDFNNCASDCKKECSIELKIKLNGADDPENPLKYVRKTINERFFNPLNSGEINSFDDIDIIAEVSCPNEDYTRFKYDNLEFYTFDDNGLTAKIKDLSLSSEDEYAETAKIYRATVTGWTSGWTSDNWLIEQIVKKQAVSASLVYSGLDISNVGQLLTNCVHLWGKDDAKFSVASMRGKSAGILSTGIVTLGIVAYEQGFHVIDPFKTYKFDFAHYSDLKNHDDGGFELATSFEQFREVPLPIFSPSTLETVSKISSCPSSSLQFFYNTKTYAGYTGFNGDPIFLNPSMISWIKLPVPLVAIHESGHSFGGLYDEYSYPGLGLIGNLIPVGYVHQTGDSVVFSKNCRPLNLFGKVFGKYGDEFLGCSTALLYRSSKNSIMRYTQASNKFNVISCGYIVQKIRGGSIEDAWKECMSLDTIKPGAECINDLDCSNDLSIGCAKCNDNKCELISFKNNQASECAKFNEKKDRLEYGLCGRPDMPNKGNCVVELNWDCNKEFGGCRDREICQKNSLGQYKCILSNP